ncbi:hypothetical protein ACE6H2_014704 [Prunus campanulata]
MITIRLPFPDFTAVCSVSVCFCDFMYSNDFGSFIKVVCNAVYYNISKFQIDRTSIATLGTFRVELVYSLQPWFLPSFSVQNTHFKSSKHYGFLMIVTPNSPLYNISKDYLNAITITL